MTKVIHIIKWYGNVSSSQSNRPSLTEIIGASITVSLPPLTSTFSPHGSVPPIMEKAVFDASARISCENKAECYAPSYLALAVAMLVFIFMGIVYDVF